MTRPSRRDSKKQNTSTSTTNPSQTKPARKQTSNQIIPEQTKSTRQKWPPRPRRRRSRINYDRSIPNRIRSSRNTVSTRVQVLFCQLRPSSVRMYYLYLVVLVWLLKGWKEGMYDPAAHLLSLVFPAAFRSFFGSPPNR